MIHSTFFLHQKNWLYTLYVQDKQFILSMRWLHIFYSPELSGIVFMKCKWNVSIWRLDYWVLRAAVSALGHLPPGNERLCVVVVWGWTQWHWGTHKYINHPQSHSLTYLPTLPPTSLVYLPSVPHSHNNDSCIGWESLHSKRKVPGDLEDTDATWQVPKVCNFIPEKN